MYSTKILAQGLASKSELSSFSAHFVNLYSSFTPHYADKIKTCKYAGMSCWDELLSVPLQLTSAFSHLPYN